MKEFMKKSNLLFLSLLISGVVLGQEMSFEQIWKQYVENSHELASLKNAKSAADLGQERGELHWLPKVSLMGQWSDTNDPGQVFFNNLGQRAITQSDFIPSALNRPDRHRFLNGMIGVDLPLYEGGLKSHQASLLKEVARASEIDIEAKKTEYYSNFGRHYGSLLIHETNAVSLKTLKSDLRKIIASYEVGSKSNPVGYSGLLGLKGVANRIDGLLTVYEMQLHNDKEWIIGKAGLISSFRPVLKSDIRQYMDNTFVHDESAKYSSLLLANEVKVNSMSYMPLMEKARYLPRVGVFAQNALYSGNRETENSQSFGLYLMWEIFSSDSYNRKSEAEAKLLAGQANLKAFKQEEEIMKSNLVASRATLEKSLELLSDSDGLLSEQSKNSMKLFRSGLLNALQLAEVINRRVDVVEQKNEAELKYLDVRSRLHQLTH
jgi:Outer membrane efflux protein